MLRTESSTSGPARRTGRRSVAGSRRRRWVWIAGPPLLLAAGALAFHRAVLRAYRTDRGPHLRTPTDHGLPFESFRFPSAGDVPVHAWWIPAPAERRNGATVVLLHGWNRNAERMLSIAPPLHGAGFDLLLPDARCHGESGCHGTATMLTFSEDLRAAVSAAIRRGADGARIGVLGHSVGGAASLHAAANDPRIRAVVTVGALAHPGDMTRLDLARRGVPRPLSAAILATVRWNVGVSLDTIAPENVISRIDAPVLLIHGERDATVPVAHAHRLAAAAPGARLLLLPARGHSDCDRDPAFWPAVLEHLGAALAC